LEAKDEGLNDKGCKDFNQKYTKVEGNWEWSNNMKQMVIQNLQREMDHKGMCKNMNSNLEFFWDVDQKVYETPNRV
jgi:hypothetical protein